MTLLDEVLDAHGGPTRWRAMRRFVVHLSIDGPLMTEKGWPGALREMAVEGQLSMRQLHMTGFGASDQIGSYHPDRTSLQRFDGTALGEWNSSDRLNIRTAGCHWSTPQLLFFSGHRIWRDINGPFLFDRADIRCEDAGIWYEVGETWRCLRVALPGDDRPACDQLLYVDANCLLRRIDYLEPEDDGRFVAQYSWAHRSFSGIVIPTLHRFLPIEPMVDLARHRSFLIRRFSMPVSNEV